MDTSSEIEKLQRRNQQVLTGITNVRTVDTIYGVLEGFRKIKWDPVSHNPVQYILYVSL